MSNPKSQTYCRCLSWALAALFGLAALCAAADSPVQAAARHAAERLAAQYTPEALMQLDEAAIEKAVTPEERAVFATKYWCFDTDVPVVVSVMRDVQQPVAPFWLEERGFRKTELRVRNEEYEYEVWQKAFPAGRVELGINGFDRHRPHYFVAVGPQPPAEKVTLSHFYPADQQVFEMKIGASIYHDWPDLVLTEVPAELQGQRLLPTIRGRAREAHLVQAFRSTPFPASEKPDQIVLTWRGDPRTTQSIQWRTAADVNQGSVKFREKDQPDAPWQSVTAKSRALEDALIVNNPKVRLFTARIEGLKPGTAYLYNAGSENNRSADAEFTTEPAESKPFTFAFLSDTHNSPVTGDLLANAAAQYPAMAFSVISGDLVGIGQYRDDWDKLLSYTAAFNQRYPMMPAVGNHDAIDGLGADLYVAEFDLPVNGPASFQPERAYSFQYGSAFFLMTDVTLSVEEQTPWIEEQLRKNTAPWTIAVLHFPPYAPDDENPDIVAQWIPLFDKYHVDFVFGGHVHHYMRSKPLRNSVPVDTPAQGTVYFLTVSTPGGPEPIPKPDYAEVFEASGVPLYVAFTVAPHQVTVEARDKDGKLHDQWAVEK